MRTTRIIFSLFLFQASTGAAQDSFRRDPRAEALVDAWISAAGGRDVWDRVTDLRYTVTTVWYDSTGIESRRRPRYVWLRKVPGGFRVRVERTEPDGRWVQGWDGATGWATRNDSLLADSVRGVREIPAVAGDLSYWIGLPWKLRDPGVRLDYAAAGDEYGTGAAVHVTFDEGVGTTDGDQFWYYFRDATAPFPDEVHYLEEGHPASDRVISVWRDWRRYGPALYVGTRTLLDSRRRPLRALLFSDVRANEGVPDRLFARPRG